MTADIDPTVTPVTSHPATRGFLPVLYAGAVLVAALYYGRELVMPFVLAALLAFVLAPACRVLQRLGVPHVPAIIVVVLLAFGVIGGLGTIVGRQVTALTGDLPRYQTTVLDKWHALGQGEGLVPRIVRSALGEALPGGEAAGSGKGLPFGLDQISGLTVARYVAQPLLEPLATFGVVLVFTIFILMSGEDLQDRLVRLVGRRDLHRTILAMNDASHRLSRYFMYQLGLNSAFGLLIGTCLWIAGMPNPALWGILAALMRFVPFIGVVIAVVPPLLLSVAAVPGWTMALLVLVLFFASEAVMGQVIEPLIYGHSTGLSPLAVMVATAFWALLWGPIGLLIATPLTVCLVVVGRHVESLAFLDVVLGDKPPLDPHETFYQRALEGRTTFLVPYARKHIQHTSLTEYFDTVALPGLALAQGDLVRDALAFERLEAIHGQIEAMLVRLDQGVSERANPKVAPGRLSAIWTGSEAILCIPGRGQLDDLAATMAVQALGRAGFGSRVAPNLELGSGDGPIALGPRLCCLSVLEQGSSVSGIRYFIKRIRKRMPEASIVVGLWHAERNSAILAELRSCGDEAHVVLSIGELLAFVRSMAVRDEDERMSALDQADATETVIGTS